MKKFVFLMTFSLFIPLFSKKIDKTNVLFRQNSHTLTKSAKKEITRFTQQINLDKLKKSGLKIEIKGYIDMSPLERAADSLALQRARSVYTFIVSNLNVPAPIVFVAKDRGKDYKILPVTKEGQRLNRRVEIKISKQRIKKPKPTKSITVEHISSHSLTVNNKPPVSTSYSAGDTLKTGKNGNAVIQVNSGSQLTLQPNSSLIVGKKAIKIVSGSIIHELQSEQAQPVTLITKSIKFRSEGLSTIEIASDTLRISQIDGTCTIKSQSETQQLSAMQGYFLLHNSDTIVTLPKMVELNQELSFKQIPGTPTPLSWNSSATAFRVQIEDSIQTYVDSIVNSTQLPVTLPVGEYQYQIQSMNSLGFKSLWSILSTVTITKKNGLLNVGQLKLNDTLMVDDRFLPLTFTLHSKCSLSLDTIVLDKEEEHYSASYKLLKGLNLLNVVTHYPDNSVDTSEFYINYSGYDERFTLNDTIMNRAAFTTTRRFLLKGTFPTATSLKVNGTEIPLQESGEFKERLTLKSYKKHPIFLDVTYENGNKVRIKRTVERIKTKSEAEDALLKVLGLTVTGGILFLVGFSIE